MEDWFTKQGRLGDKPSGMEEITRESASAQEFI
jgi:hypothetical protein